MDSTNSNINPRSRLANHVNKFKQVFEEGNVSAAKERARLALNDATKQLENPGIDEGWRDYCLEVKKQMGKFLENPEVPDPNVAAKKSGGKGGGTGNESVDKIKSTDWFAAPIPNLNLSNIAGLPDLKDAFLYNIFAATSSQFSDIYRKYRGEVNGIQVLLFGPPGTGKTHAVKCLAGEMKCKIAVVQIKDVMANLVGDGAKIIAEIFDQAAQYDRCIIFFDEIDAIASSREGDDSRHTKEQLTTLLTYMDGFTSKAKPNQLRVVIAATNRPWALDSAVKRGGRFDTQIYVPLPDKLAREELVKMALGRSKSSKPEDAKPPLAPDVTIDWIAERTEGFAGADIKSICRQAVAYPMKREITARRTGKVEDHFIERRDFETVFGKYINSTTDEDLMHFDAYGMNMEYGNEYLKIKFHKIVADLYHNFVCSRLSEQERRAKNAKLIEIPLYERNYIKKLCPNSAIFEKNIEDKYKGKTGFFEYVEKFCAK